MATRTIYIFALSWIYP